jgi:hypothetical protein
MDDSTVLEELLGPLRAEFHAHRTTALTRADVIAQALERYTYQVELDVARQLASSHGLRQPRDRSDVRKAAQELLNSVLALPELTENTTPTLTPPANVQAPLQAEQPTVSPKSPWPALAKALVLAPLVMVGGAPHHERIRQMPADLLKAVEWVDTRQKGTHAIGNLERRIREHRICGLVLLEGLVQHKHTDPLVSAARGANVPCVYAGKGGTLAIANALKEIEKALASKK